MIRYKYSFWVDISWMYKNFKNRHWLQKKELVVFQPSLKRFFYLITHCPQGVDIVTPFPITCFWLSSGTWGSFTPPDKIFICPWRLDGGMYSGEELKRVINHEINHLCKYEETKDLSFEEREKIINEIK